MEGSFVGERPWLGDVLVVDERTHSGSGAGPHPFRSEHAGRRSRRASRPSQRSPAARALVYVVPPGGPTHRARPPGAGQGSRSADEMRGQCNRGVRPRRGGEVGLPWNRVRRARVTERARSAGRKSGSGISPQFSPRRRQVRGTGGPPHPTPDDTAIGMGNRMLTGQNADAWPASPIRGSPGCAGRITIPEK